MTVFLGKTLICCKEGNLEHPRPEMTLHHNDDEEKIVEDEEKTRVDWKLENPQKITNAQEAKLRF